MSKKVLYFVSSEDSTGIDLAIEHGDDDDVTILLLQNAVYFANKTNKAILNALDKKKTVVACKPDVDIRGLNDLISDKINLVTMEDVVDLIFTNDTIINM